MFFTISCSPTILHFIKIVCQLMSELCTVISAVGFLLVVVHNFNNASFFTENMSGSLCESVPSTNEPPNKKVMRKAVVVLTRLPEYKVSALLPPTPQQFYIEFDSHSGSDSDMQWEPEGGSSDSDFSVSQDKRKTGKPTKSEAKRTPAPKTSKNKDNGDTSIKKVTDPAPVIISSAFSYVSNETTKTRPSMPQEEVKVDMVVLARRKPMRWQRGKIVEILTRGKKFWQEIDGKHFKAWVKTQYGPKTWILVLLWSKNIVLFEKKTTV